jgi:hypothetical protein
MSVFAVLICDPACSESTMWTTIVVSASSLSLVLFTEISRLPSLFLEPLDMHWNMLF